jgi:hypothetical protein
MRQQELEADFLAAVRAATLEKVKHEARKAKAEADLAELALEAGRRSVRLELAQN